MTCQQLVQLGLSHHQAGRRTEAQSLYRQALDLDPASHVISFLLGALLLETGPPAEAMERLSQAVALGPQVPEYHNAFGLALLNTERLPEAAAAFERAVQLRANYPDAYYGLGRAYMRMGEADGAITSLQKAIALKPAFAAAYSELANAYSHRGQMDQALAMALQAVQIDPPFAWGHNILGLIYQGKGQFQQALASFRQAIAMRPDLAEAHMNIAHVRWISGQFVDAMEDLKKAAALAPLDARPLHNLGVVLSDIGQNTQAIVAFRQALALNPASAEAGSALLLTLNYEQGFTGRQRWEEHYRWGQQQARIEPMPLAPASGGRLRVGYVSADFCAHPVSWFIEPVLANHDQARFQVFCYSDVLQPDSVTERLRRLPVTWRDIRGMGHENTAKVIHADAIDILVDLGGHTRRNRLLMFARRPGRIQVSYLGYPNTTGLPQVDYRLTDAFADPAGQGDEFYSEKLIRLPGSFLCYCPPTDAPAVAPPPSAARAGAITFGSFNNLAKLTTATIEVWAAILNAVAGSRLLLKNRSLSDSRVAQAVAERFAACGIGPDRLELRPPAARTADHLAIYNEVDIALDTFPYNGTTTTCEGLWMGVPVITWTGDTHAARVGTSILRNVDLPELIGSSLDDYAHLAVDLALTPSRLGPLRAQMRDRLLRSPLLDAENLTSNLEQAFLSLQPSLPQKID